MHVYLYEFGGHSKLTKYLVVVKGGGMGGDRDWKKDDKSGIDAVDKAGNFVQVVSACFFLFFFFFVFCTWLVCMYKTTETS